MEAANARTTLPLWLGVRQQNLFLHALLGALLLGALLLAAAAGSALPEAHAQQQQGGNAQSGGNASRGGAQQGEGAASDTTEGFQALWDGATFAGWHKSGSGAWTVEDSVLVGRHAASEEAYGHLVSDAAYGDFTARLEFKSVEGNSGFYFRVREVPGPAGVEGFQAEVDPSDDIGGLYETGGRGWVVRPGPEEIEQFYKPGQWNEMTVRARGNSATVWVNGTKTAEVTGDWPMSQRGHFALQLHGGQDVEVRFRNLQIKGQPVKP